MVLGSITTLFGLSTMAIILTTALGLGVLRRALSDRDAGRLLRRLAELRQRQC